MSDQGFVIVNTSICTQKKLFIVNVIDLALGMEKQYCVCIVYRGTAAWGPTDGASKTSSPRCVGLCTGCPSKGFLKDTCLI